MAYQYRGYLPIRLIFYFNISHRAHNKPLGEVFQATAGKLQQTI